VDLHALGESDAAGVADRGLVELVDEAVAFQKAGGQGHRAEGGVRLLLLR
jgi:hypothetical protein